MAIVNELITSLGFKLGPKAIETINLVEKSISGVVKMADKLGKSFTVAKGMMDYFTGVAVKDAKGIRDLSKAYGISTEAYQRWGHAARVAGVSAESLYNDLRKLKLEKGFTDQGIIDWMNKLSSANPRDALRILEDLNLSEDFLKLIRTQGGTGSVLKLLADAGPLLTDEEVENAAKYAENMNSLLSHLDSMKKKAFIQLSPEFNKQIKTLEKWLEENKYFIKEITAAGQALSKGFSKFFNIIEKIYDALSKRFRILFGYFKADFNAIEVAANAICAALLIMTGAKIIGGLAKLAGIIKSIAIWMGIAKASAAGTAAGAAAGAAAGGTAAGAAAIGFLGKGASIAGILGGGWMVGEEIANLMSEHQQYNWLERMVKPISEFIVGDRIGDYRNIGNGPQQPTQIVNNITVNPATEAASQTVTGMLMDYLAGNGNAVLAE